MRAACITMATSSKSLTQCLGRKYEEKWWRHQPAAALLRRASLFLRVRFGTPPSHCGVRFLVSPCACSRSFVNSTREKLIFLITLELAQECDRLTRVLASCCCSAGLPAASTSACCDLLRQRLMLCTVLYSARATVASDCFFLPAAAASRVQSLCIATRWIATPFPFLPSRPALRASVRSLSRCGLRSALSGRHDQRRCSHGKMGSAAAVSRACAVSQSNDALGPRAPQSFVRPALGLLTVHAVSASSSLPSPLRCEMSSAAKSPPPPPEIVSFVSLLKSHGIQCVAFDMDRTLVSAHSGGAVSSSGVDEFAESITKASRLLIPYLLEQGLRVAVATFADDLYASYSRGSIAGVELVKRVLGELPVFDGQMGRERLRQVPIVTINPDLYVVEIARSNSGSAASEEQRRMKSLGSSSSASAAHSADHARKTQELQSFFETKLCDFGFDMMHPHWKSCAAFPPAPFKNHHLTMIAAKCSLARHQLLLIDDRDENVDAAVESGSWGLYLQGLKKGLMIADLAASNIKPPKKKAEEAATATTATPHAAATTHAAAAAVSNGAAPASAASTAASTPASAPK